MCMPAKFIIEKIWHEPEHPTCNVTIKVKVKNIGDSNGNVTCTAIREDGKRFWTVEFVKVPPGESEVYYFKDTGDGWCLPDGCYKYTIICGDIKQDYTVCIGTATCPIKCEKLEAVKTKEHNVVLRGTFKNYGSYTCTREFYIEVFDLTGGGSIPYYTKITLNGGEIKTKDIHMDLGDGKYKACLYDGLTQKCVTFTVSESHTVHPPSTRPSIILKANKTNVSEGEPVQFTVEIYDKPNVSVKVYPYVEGNKSVDYFFVPLDNNGYGKKTFTITFPEAYTYRVKACVVELVNNKPIYCSNEIVINVGKSGDAKFTVNLNVNKTTINKGDTVTANCTVKNVGTTTGGCTVYLYKNNQEIAHFPIAALAPNKTSSFNHIITFNNIGKFNIKACAVYNGKESCSKTITITVKETPNPQFYCSEGMFGTTINYCYLEYKGKQILPNQSVDVVSDETLHAHFGVRANGYIGKVGLQILDVNTNKQIAWLEHNFKNSYDVWFDKYSFKVSKSWWQLQKDVKIRYVLYKQVGGTWEKVAEYGDFNISMRPFVIETPDLEINYVWTDRSTYYVNEPVFVKAEVVNNGTKVGSSSVFLYVDDKFVDKQDVTVNPGQYVPLTFKLDSLPIGDHKICIQIFDYFKQKVKCVNVTVKTPPSPDQPTEPIEPTKPSKPSKPSESTKPFNNQLLVFYFIAIAAIAFANMAIALKK